MTLGLTDKMQKADREGWLVSSRDGTFSQRWKSAELPRVEVLAGDF